MISIRQAWCGTCRLVIVWAVAQAVVSPPAAAQVPPPSRDELMRKWDLDRDGKVDASETEIARSRMRRARNEALMNSGTDPVTGQPRVPTDPVTGRPLAAGPGAAAGSLPSGRAAVSPPADDGGLILVPGTGEAPGAAAGAATTPDAASRSTQRERPALPGTRAPAPAATVPSVSPRPPTAGLTPGPQAAASGRDAGGGEFGGRELSSRARIIPGQPQSQTPLQNPGPRDARPRSAGQERQPGAAERPGIIAGGVRAGGAAARPGYGAGGPPADLNAGRLPGGLPQTRGIVPGSSIGPRGSAAVQPGTGRLAGPGQPTTRPGMGASGMGTYRGPGVPPAPSTGIQQVPRPMVRQPPGVRPSTQAPSTVPRVPRVSSDDFYGR
jgi:hypothetical protein